MKQSLSHKQKLPDGWKWSKIESVCKKKPQSGGTPLSSNPDFYGGNIPWVITEDLTSAGRHISSTLKKITQLGFDNSNVRLFPKGTVLFAMYGSIGRMSIAKIELTTNQAILGLIPHEEIITSEYLYYYLEFAKNKLIRSGRGGTQSNINAKMVCEFPIILPPLFVQKEIVSKLDQQMAQIEIMKREAEKTKSTSEEIYESITNRLITLSNGEKKKIGQICVQCKKTILPGSESSKKLTYLGMEEIASNTGEISINKQIQGDKILSNTFYFDDKMILYGKLRPYLNKVATPNFEGRCSTELIPILPSKDCNKYFLAAILRTQKVIHAAMKNKTGSRMPRADMDEIFDVEVLLPVLQDQEKIMRDLKFFQKEYLDLQIYLDGRIKAISQLPLAILNEIFGKYSSEEENDN